MYDKIIEIITNPITWLMDCVMEPIQELVLNATFIIKNPLLNSELLNIYNFFYNQGLKLIGTSIVLSLVFFAVSGDFFEKGKWEKTLSDSLVGLLLLLGNKIFVFITNFLFTNLTLGALKAPYLFGTFSDLMLIGIIAAVIAGVATAGLGIIFALILVILFFALMVSMDMLEIVINTFVVLSPIFISVYPFSPLRKYTVIFYDVYIKSHLAVLIQVTIMSVVTIMDKGIDRINIIGRLSFAMATLLIMVSVVPAMAFRAISNINRT